MTYLPQPTITDVLSACMPVLLVALLFGVVIGVLGWVVLEIISFIISLEERRNADKGPRE